MNVKVNLKKIGKKRNSVEAVSYCLEKKPETVRDLIEETVKSCVKDYKNRQENTELLRNLTYEEIEDKAISGKISFGINYGEGEPVLDDAVENALQSFKDGIYRIILEDETLTEIDEKIEIKEGSQLTFIRLTMLTGRMW